MESTLNPSQFKYLINTQHEDPDSGLPYRTIKVKVKKGLIVCDRLLTNAKGDASTVVETIHAMDIALYTLVLTPNLPCALLLPSQDLKDFLELITRNISMVKPQQTSRKRKSVPHNCEQSFKFHLENQQHYLNQLNQADLTNENVNMDNTAKSEDQLA